MTTILISTNSISLEAELDDSPSAQAILRALPIEGRANRWGDEIYFEIPVSEGQEPDAREVLEVGELAYWPVGRAFCIFFGLTPVSDDERPKAYSPVNVVGRVLGDATRFRAVRDGDPISISNPD